MLWRRRSRRRTDVDATSHHATTTAFSRTASSASIEAAEPLGEVTVVAPDREQSATSHSLTLHHPAAPGASRRAPLAGGRHADRLRDARGRGADARAARLRAERHQPRPEHGRGRALLRHRRRGDGRTRARHSVDRASRSPAATCAPTSRYLERAGRRSSRRSSQHLTSLPTFPARHAAQREPPAGAGRRGEGRAAHAARAARVLELARSR